MKFRTASPATPEAIRGLIAAFNLDWRYRFLSENNDFCELDGCLDACSVLAAGSTSHSFDNKSYVVQFYLREGDLS